MIGEVDKRFEHVVELRPGDSVDIELRFAMDEGASVNVTLVSVNVDTGTADLVIEDMWSGYQMEWFSRDADRWMPVWAAGDEEVHVTVNFGLGDQLAVSSDLAYVHSLDLAGVSWQGTGLRLTFIETA